MRGRQIEKTKYKVSLTFDMENCQGEGIFKCAFGNKNTFLKEI